MVECCGKLSNCNIKCKKQVQIVNYVHAVLLTYAQLFSFAATCSMFWPKKSRLCLVKIFKIFDSFCNVCTDFQENLNTGNSRFLYFLFFNSTSFQFVLNAIRTRLSTWMWNLRRILDKKKFHYWLMLLCIPVVNVRSVFNRL